MITLMGTKLYSATEVAELLGISRETLGLYAKTRDIEDRRVNRVRYYTEEEIRLLVNLPEKKSPISCNMSKTVNSYNFVTRGTVLFHAIAVSAERAVSLATERGFHTDGLDIELERENVRDEMGRPFRESISEALVR